MRLIGSKVLEQEGVWELGGERQRNETHWQQSVGTEKQYGCTQIRVTRR
jgi:hypothetical protein